ncbi:YesL family protein [Neobacillus kokaensis]|uniref:YesL family protein n=1 Tax=Neobacillus kokaensis TaxID=2759023 RepID=UPI00174E8594|nr:DUF624 domain-containing protein [Neobacillus kokaensis]
MFQQGYMGKLNTIMEWIMRFFVLQLVWILFSFAGLIVGGIFPATFSMFAICRKWLNKETEFSIFREFKAYFCEGFIKTNLLGLLMTATGFSLYYYYQLFKAPANLTETVLVIIVWIAGILYIMTVLFIIPVYVHFDIKLFSVIRHAAIIAIAHPFQVLSMAALIACFCILIILIPGLFPFFSFSLLSFGLMWMAKTAFIKMEQKISILSQSNSVI